MRCNQCDSAVINGVFCHERGCPNRYKIYDKKNDQWVDENDSEDWEDRNDEWVDEDEDMK